MMTAKAILFYGAGPLPWLPWGGIFTSFGVYLLAGRLRKLGIDATCYEYGDYAKAKANLLTATGPRLGFAYSNGNTALSLLWQDTYFDLAFCIAESEAAGINNRPVVKANVRRSVLWMGPDSFSDAGATLGFDYIGHSAKPHLLIDFDDAVTNSAIAEATAAMQ